MEGKEGRVEGHCCLLTIEPIPMKEGDEVSHYKCWRCRKEFSYNELVDEAVELREMEKEAERWLDWLDQVEKNWLDQLEEPQ